MVDGQDIPGETPSRVALWHWLFRVGIVVEKDHDSSHLLKLPQCHAVCVHHCPAVHELKKNAMGVTRWHQDHISCGLQGLELPFCGNLECFHSISASFSVGVKWWCDWGTLSMEEGVVDNVLKYTGHSAPWISGPWSNSEFRPLLHNTGTWRKPSGWNYLACSHSKWSFSMIMPIPHSQYHNATAAAVSLRMSCPSTIQTGP